MSCSSVDRFGYHWYCDAIGACDVLGADLLEKEAATCCSSSWSRYGQIYFVLIKYAVSLFARNLILITENYRLHEV